MKKVYVFFVPFIFLNQLFSEVIETKSFVSHDQRYSPKESYKVINNDVESTKRKADSQLLVPDNSSQVKKNTPQTGLKNIDKNQAPQMQKPSATSEGIKRLNEAKRWIVEKRKQLHEKEIELANKEKNLSSQEEEFINKQKLLVDREQLLASKEKELANKYTQLTELEQFYEIQEQELNNKKEQLSIKEQDLLEKELECVEKENIILSKEKELIVKEKMLLQKKDKKKLSF